MTTRGRKAQDAVFATTTDLINYSGVWDAGQTIETTGYATVGDGGDALWMATGNAIAASQTPALTGDATLSDANGNEFELFNKGSFNVKELGVVGDGSTDDSAVINICLDYSSSSKSIMKGGGLEINCKNKLLVGDNVYLNMPTDTFIKDYISAESNTDALFTNKSYASEITPNVNISFDGLNITTADSSQTGAFMSLNWVNGCKILNFNFLKDTVGTTALLTGKNYTISKGFIDSSAATQFCDGLHFEYLEDSTISDCIISTQDDAIAFAYNPATFSSAGPNFSGRNVVVSNCVLSSQIANGLRVGTGFIGDVPNSNNAHPNAYYENILFNNITINHTGATGRSIAIYDERTNSAFKHNNIKFNHIIMKDDTSITGQIEVRGNQDITDITNITTKNIGDIYFSNITIDKGTGGSWFIGGAEKVAFNDVVLNDDFSKQESALIYQVNNLQFTDCDLNTSATARILLIREVKDFKYQGNRSLIPVTATAAIQFQSTIFTDGDLIIKDNTFDGGNASFATLSPLTCDTFHHTGNSRINVVTTTTGTVAANLSKVVDDYN